MRLIGKVTVISIILYAGTVDGYNTRRVWGPISPHFQQQFLPFQPVAQLMTNSGYKISPTETRPNVGKIGIRSIVSSHVQEYPIPPMRPQSRVIIAKMESFGMTKRFPSPGMMVVAGDPLGKMETSKEFVSGTIESKIEDIVSASKVADLKRVLIDVPLDKLAEFQMLPIGLLEAVKEAALDKFLMPMLPEKGEDLKDALDEKQTELTDKLVGEKNDPKEMEKVQKDLIDEKDIDFVGTNKDELIDPTVEKVKDKIQLDSLRKSENVKDLVWEKVIDPLEKIEGLKELVGEKLTEHLEKSGDLKDIVQEKVSNPLEKVAELKSHVGDKVTDQADKISDLKDQTEEKVNDALEKHEDLKDLIEDKVPGQVEKLDDLKDVAEEKVNDALQKVEDLKELLGEKATDPLEKVEDLKDLVEDKVTEAVEKLHDLKDLAEEKVNNALEKVDDLKDLAGEKVDDLKDLAGEKVDDLKGLAGEKVDDLKGLAGEKVDDLKALVEEKLIDPLDKVDDLKDLAGEKVDDLKDLAGEKVDDLKGLVEEKLIDPLDKVEDLKGLAGEKVDDLKDLVEEKITDPLEKVEDLKDQEREKVDDLKGLVEGKLIDPSEKVEDLKDLVKEKMEDLKGQAEEKVTGPLEKLGGLMDLLEEKKTESIEKVENLKNVSETKISNTLEKADDLKDKLALEKTDAVVGKLLEPADKLDGKVQGFKSNIIDKPESISDKADLTQTVENVKDAVVEKAEKPLEKVKEVKSTVIDKNDRSGLVKVDNILDPKLDLKNAVFDALRHSIGGDRKQYFKQALTNMSKGELDDLHEALLHAFNLKGFTLPMVENAKEDLKDAAHELAVSGTDKGKTEALSEIEHVLEPQAKAALKDDSSVKSMENAAGKHPEQGFITNSLSEKGIVSFGNLRGIQGGTGSRWRRWNMSPAAPHYRPLYVYLPQQTHQVAGWGWGRKKRSIYGTGVGTLDQELHSFPPPASLRLPMKTAFRQINSASPPDPYFKSKDALSLPLLSMNEPATDKILSDIKGGLQYVLQTRNDWTFAIHGTGTTACHAVLDNLIESGDKVLVLENGYWGELMANMADRLGAHVIRFKKDPGTTFTTEEVEIALKVHKPDIVLIVHGESSTGVYQKLEGIGDLCQKYGALLVADVVAVAGIQPVLMDKTKIDAVFLSSHKGLGGVVGLAPVSLSPRAVNKVKNRLTPPRALQTDLALQAELWNTKNPDRSRIHSMSVPLLYALREALATIVEERMENTLKRHALTQEHLNRGLAALGLENYVQNPNDRLIGITTVKPPPGKDPRKIAKYMFKNYNIEISSGSGPTDGKVLRFATFASNADITRVSLLLRALKNALRSRETSTSY